MTISQLLVDVVADRMKDCEVRLLDVGRVARGHAQAEVGDGGERRVPISRQSDDVDARAATAAFTTFGEEPLVEIAISMSPSRPSASTWRAKISANA